MNINFIRNLSDEILRQNQQLKGEIITLKQKVADYQEEMINAVAEITPPTLASPRGVLRGFINGVRQVMTVKRELQQSLKQKTSECKSVCLQEEMAQEQIICLKSQLQLERRQKKDIQQQNKNASSEWQKEMLNLEKEKEQLSIELIQLKEQLRLERLMMVDAKRREVEEVRQYHMKELLDFRDKADRQVVAVEKQMHAQLLEKDNTIKNLEKALQKLSLNVRLDQSESGILVKLLSSFQQYNHLSKVIQQRSEQLSRFRQQLQQVDMARIKAQSKLKQVTSSEVNLLGQIQRLGIDKRNLDNKLGAMTQLFQKSEQDKDAMELYYHTKWNKEYSNVKIQLEKTYLERIRTIEADCAQQLQKMGQIVRQAEKRLQNTLQRNQMVEEDMKKRQQDLEKAKKEILKMEKHIVQLKQEKSQIHTMSEQELVQVKLTNRQTIIFLQSQINSLNNLISLEKNIYEDLQKQHENDIQQINESHRTNFERVLCEKQRERKVMQNSHEKQLLALQIKLESKERFIKDARANFKLQFQADYELRMQAAQRQVQSRSKEKQEEMTRNNSKWMVRFKEIDLKYNNFKRRTQDEQELYKKQINRLEAQNKILHSSEEKLRAQAQDIIVAKGQFLIRITDLQKRINQLSLKSEQSAEDKESLELQAQSRKKQMKELKQSRQVWLCELKDLQKSYKSWFQSLKRTHQKQLGLLKSKIWELQQVVRKRPIKKRDFERLQQMDKQRKQLRNEVYIKQAENIILNQVKDYYQSKLREQDRPAPEQSHAGTALMGYKLKMLKRSTNKQSFTFNELEQPKEATEMRKYIVRSTKRSMKLSLSKIRCEDMNRYHRMHTAYD